MAKCPYLDFREKKTLYSDGDYYCRLLRKTLSMAEVNHKCNTEQGHEYEKCIIYQDRWQLCLRY